MIGKIIHWKISGPIYMQRETTLCIDTVKYGIMANLQKEEKVFLRQISFLEWRNTALEIIKNCRIQVLFTRVRLHAV